MQRHGTATAERRNISHPPLIGRVLDELAGLAGHGVVSRLIQDWAVEKAREVWGPEWRARFERDEERVA